MLATAKNGQDVFGCAECGLHYRDREWADRCEQWCREHKSCNLEITKHALENQDLK